MKVLVEMDEVWKKIKNWPYKVSNYGRVKRNSSDYNSTYIGKILKPGLIRGGYLMVVLCKNGKRKNSLVHRLVIESFLGPCPKGKEVNHIDGIKINNEIWNLEYVTRSENHKHAYKLGLERQDGENNNNSKLTKNQVRKIRKLYNDEEYSHSELSEMFGVKTQSISKIINYKRWKHVS